MSRLWNKSRLCVFLGEDHLAICRVGARGRVLDKDRISVSAGEGTAVAALEAWLAAHPAAPGTQIEIVLGLPHLRYLLLPWSPELIQASFRDSLARALFARQFQDEFAMQDVRYGAARYGRPLLAACVSRSLLAQLSSIAIKHGLSLGNVEPLLSAVWNRFQPQLRRRSGTLLIAEASRVLIVRQERGALADLQIRPAGADDVAVLAQRLASAADCKVFAPQQPALAGSLPAAWLAPGLRDGFNPARDGVYAYALCGVG